MCFGSAFYHQHGTSSALTCRQSPSAHLWLRPSRHESSQLLLLSSAVRAAFVVSFLVPLHHTTSALGLHHLCCPTNAPWEPNHSTSLHRVFFAFCRNLHLTSWLLNILHTTSVPFPLPQQIPLKPRINVYPQFSCHAI